MKKLFLEIITGNKQLVIIATKLVEEVAKNQARKIVGEIEVANMPSLDELRDELVKAYGNKIRKFISEEKLNNDEELYKLIVQPLYSYILRMGV